MYILKRSGLKEKYDRARIIKAIYKGFKAVNEEFNKEFWENQITILEKQFYNKITVAEIQKKVINLLMQLGKYEVATDYIEYKTKRDIARSEDINANTLVSQYISQMDDMVYKENSSTVFSLQGLNEHLFGTIAEKYWLNLYSPEIKLAHDTGRVHIHDLKNISVYCVGWDLKQLLEEGITGVPGKPVSGPAKHFLSAINQSMNFIFSLQGEAAGALAFSNFNTLLAPFVSYDNLSYQQLKSIMQMYVFDMNNSTRVGFQSPFSNITIDLFVQDTPLAEEYVIIGGKPQTTKYKDYQKEADMITRAFLEVMMEGDYNGAIMPYPIPTFNVTPNFPWESEIGDLVSKVAAKYGIPYFANFLNSDLDPNDVRSMCCRLKLDLTQIEKHVSDYAGGLNDNEYDSAHHKSGGFFGAAPKTGSIGVVTLGLPAIAHDVIQKHKDNAWSKLFDEIKNYMDLALESLNKKRKIIEILADKGLYPYTMYYLKDVKLRTGHYFTQHFSTICVNGIHEALILLGINDGINVEEGQDKAFEIVKFMKDYSIELQKEHKVLLNIEQAPAESAGVKLCRKSGIDPLHNGYYTNSSWFPADTTVDLFKQIEVQGKINEHYTGGSSFHNYTDEDLEPVYKELSKIIIYAFTKTKLPYMTISPVFSVCETCGNIPGRHTICPKCNSNNIETYSRIVGYYRTEKNFNNGRLNEAIKRQGFYVKIKDFISNLKK